MYPALGDDGTLIDAVNKLQFRIGLTPWCKPNKDYVSELIRTFRLKETYAVSLPPPSFDSPSYYPDDDDSDFGTTSSDNEDEEADDEHPSRFHFSLSTSLEPLVEDRLLAAVQLRLKYKIGWAGAELLLAESARQQMKPEDLYEVMHQVAVVLSPRVGRSLMNVLSRLLLLQM